ncbi:hypothetical protein P691DRAFT_664543 [Macrolepiota fuliginosa MF-IS2]|uniref:Uncharacterized protein n=1 Tax=Macrolepiota fuliginosa MF-IS2 TaxID=1400762 RepID=A0A9P6C3K1_9AGAR|nr:hypothetical protein P691DRAFT_664543 [Macrolepiota fuliginosa MF-IS2]
MSYSSRSRVLSYSEVARNLVAEEVQKDVGDACKALAKTMLDIMDQFECISKMVHSVDMLGLTVALRPRWDGLRRNFAELLWQFRTTAGNISGRLKMFSMTILPMVATRPDGEALQVLQSFMAICADHANFIRILVEHTMGLGSVLASFHTEFAKFTNIQTKMGQKELRDLSSKVHELDAIMRDLSTANGRLSNPDPTHLLYAVMRVGTASGRRPTRSKLSHQKLTLSGTVAQVGTIYESFDQKRNEVAHAVYSAQLCFGKGDKFSNTQTSLSTLVSDEIIHFESGLSLILGIWARLLADSTDIYQWLRNPSKNRVPAAVVDYKETGSSFYTTLSMALDVCVSGIDPSRFPKT